MLSPWPKSRLVTVVRCVLLSLLVEIDRFGINIKDSHSGPNPAFSEVIDTPSTSLSANASFAPGYLNLLAPSRPNLNSFPKDKNNRCFCPRWFRTHTRIA